MRAWLDANEERLDDATREKAATSPLRVFDNIESKPDAVQEALREAPTIGESLCEACAEHFAAVRRDLDANGVEYEIVPTLVRGLDYYTRTTWEFLGPGEGAQRALSGGGRYDGLVEEIGGPPTPGVGFGAGIERLILAAQEAGIEPPPPPCRCLPRHWTTARRGSGSQRWLAELRGSGVASDTDYAGRSLKGQLTHAARLGAATTVVVRGDGATIRRTGQADARSTARRSPRERNARELAGPHLRGASRRARRAHDHARGLGRHPAGSRRPRLRGPAGPHGRHAARDQSGALTDRCRARAGDPERVRPPGDRRGRGAVARDRQPQDAHRRGRAPGRPPGDPLALDAAAVSARRGERGRAPAAALPVARPSDRPHAAKPPPVRNGRVSDPPAHGGARLPRPLDAEPHAGDSRRRPRLPRSRAAPARARSSRCRSRRRSSSSSS